MPSLEIGNRVQIISSIPGFHLRRGHITSVAHPVVASERNMDEALRELRLYDVRLDNGRHLRFRGRDLVAFEPRSRG
ncbi:MAG TPA: hypothetical protein VFY29_21020 [Terriglobia bacterium]|nr:hypothetical protein [Terriglobia bacterium]